MDTEMILYKLIFGDVKKHNSDKSEDLIHNYISALYHNGQANGEYFIVVQKGKLCAYINMQGIQANLSIFHCKYGIERLKNIKEHFGMNPTWNLIDDDAPKKDITWKNSPFLYLFTHMNDNESALCRGDNGKPIPIYLLLGEYENRAEIFSWQGYYKNFDSIWIGCGELEIPAYKQLASPFSQLSKDGREICKNIECITGIPTYYYLMRYWGRRKKEELRKCPDCGKSWNLSKKINLDVAFYQFPFKCEDCRLVSHLADSYDDERHAVIGEYNKRKMGK